MCFGSKTHISQYTGLQVLTIRKQTNSKYYTAYKTFKLYYYSPLNSDLNGRIGK